MGTPQQQQQQQQAFSPPFAPFPEHARPLLGPPERNSLTLNTLNQLSTRISLSSGSVLSRQPTRISFPSLNSAALSNSVNEVQQQQYSQAVRQQQQQQEQQRSIVFGLPTFQKPPQHPLPEEREKEQQQPLSSSPVRSPSLSRSHSRSSHALPNPPPVEAGITTRRVVEAVAGRASSLEASQSAAGSLSQALSSSIARRNRDKAVLFVGQLNYEATEADVAQVFACYGKPLSVVVLKDKGKSARRGRGGGGGGAAATAQRKVGGSAFVTYGSTMEADTAIMALHGRYNAKDDDPDHDDEAKFLQVSYGQQTGLISTFGTIHAKKLHASKPENPIPLIVLERRRVSAAASRAEE